MTNNINKNKNKHNDAIEHGPNFDNTFSLSNETNDPLPVVTVSIRVGKKQREEIIPGLTCLWNSGATDIMIKR